MKNIYILPLILFITFSNIVFGQTNESFSKEEPQVIDRESLIIRDGLYYIKDTNELYTGISKRRNNRGEIHDSIKNGISLGYTQYNQDGKVIRTLLETYDGTDGIEIRYNKDGEILQEVIWENGEIIYISDYDDGNIVYEGTYDNKTSWVSGPYKFYYKNGNIKEEGNIELCKFCDHDDLKGFPLSLVSDIMIYNENGEPRNGVYNRYMEKFELIPDVGFITDTLIFSESTLKDGKLDGIYKEYFFGVLSKEIIFVDGIRHGLYKDYWDKGQLNSEIEYKDGEPVGSMKVYHLNGQLSFGGNYNIDDRIGLWKWYDENGKILKENTYNEDGKLIETKEY